MDVLSGTMLAQMTTSNAIAFFGAVFAIGLAIPGAAFGMSRIGSKAVESISRQPEASDNIFKAMIVAIAFVESVTLFAIALCFMALYWAR